MHYTMQLLIDAGADVDKAEANGATPLYAANQYGCSSQQVLTWTEQPRMEPHYCMLLHTAGIINRCSCSSQPVLV